MRKIVAAMVVLACGFGMATAQALKPCQEFPEGVSLELAAVESIDGLPAFGSPTEHNLWLNDAGTRFSSEIVLTRAYFDEFEQAATYEQPIEKFTLVMSDGTLAVMEIER
jgi:hypothetical protein